MRTHIRLLLVCLFVFVIPAAAQVQVRMQKARWVSPTDGEKLYMAYCASCHGADLKADTSLRQLQSPTPNLTRIAKTSSEAPVHVRTMISHGLKSSQHDAYMRSWKTILEGVYRDEKLAHMAVTNLTKYIMSQQQ